MDRDCVHCGEIITEERLPEFVAPRLPVPAGQRSMALLGVRYVSIWVHVWTGHERCWRRDTNAEPAPGPASAPVPEARVR